MFSFRRVVGRAPVAVRANTVAAVAGVYRRCSTNGASPSAEERIAELEAVVANMAHVVHQLTNSRVAGADDQFIPPHVLRTVVKIFANVAAPHHLLPWQKKLQQQVSGTGFVVDKARRLLMTNTHVVGRATSIQVRRHGAGHRHGAEIVYIAADCDVALLRVDDDAFWAEVEEAQFEGAEGKLGLDGLCGVGPSGAIPDLQAHVKVVGFPWGGDQVSITSGVVSRVDMTSYGGVDAMLLGIQIDAAINSGNSGGPALVDGKVIGIAFQTLIAASNIGYLIPACVAAVCVRAYVTMHVRAAVDAAGSKFVDTHVASVVNYHSGFTTVGVTYQDMASPALRAKFRFTSPQQSGCLVEHVFRRSSAEGYLRPGDIICRVNGYSVADDATVQWKPDQRICFSHFVRCTKPGDNFDMVIWRDGQEMALQIPAKLPHQLVANHVFSDRYREVLPYCVFGGCVFTELTLGYLLEWGDNDWNNLAPRWLTSQLFPSMTQQGEDRESVVVLSQMLPHPVNRGYNGDYFMNRVVRDVNGVEIQSFDHLLDTLSGLADDDTATLRLSNGNSTMSLVLPTGAARKANTELAVMYGIPAVSRRSGVAPTA